MSDRTQPPSGPLQGLRIVEFAGMGPAPFCGMLLSDLGADVIRIDRPGGPSTGGPEIPSHLDILARGRRSIALDLKHQDAVELCLQLIEKADAVLEGYRPGVMERLSLGPETCLGRNPRLVYGRMTGWGQTGPLAALAGHDLNYLAISGGAHAIGAKDQPYPPLNLAGDFGGGALYLAFGVVSAILHAQRCGEGQVIDCAMSDGVASLLTSIYMLKACEQWSDERGANLLDGGAHFYNIYKCADARWISVAAIEPKFYALLLEKTGLSDPGMAALADRAQWPGMRDRLAEIFAGQSRDAWCNAMAGVDSCFAPVLDLNEAPRHPHNVARRTFEERFGVMQPAPAPRFSCTPGAIQRPPPRAGEHSRSVLEAWGIATGQIDACIAAGAVRQA